MLLRELSQDQRANIADYAREHGRGDVLSDIEDAFELTQSPTNMSGEMNQPVSEVAAREIELWEQLGVIDSEAALTTLGVGIALRPSPEK